MVREYKIRPTWSDLLSTLKKNHTKERGISIFRKYYLKLRSYILAHRLITLGLLILAVGVICWMGFNALALLSDVNCNVSCYSTADTSASSGLSLFGGSSSVTPNIDCRTNCGTFCSVYPPTSVCRTDCNTDCESSSIDIDVDVDVNCDSSCGLYPPSISLRSVKTLFTPTYLRILIRRSFGF